MCVFPFLVGPLVAHGLCSAGVGGGLPAGIEQTGLGQGLGLASQLGEGGRKLGFKKAACCRDCIMHHMESILKK